VHSLGNAKTPPAATKDQRFELVASIEPIVTIALRAAGHMGSDFCLSALDQVFPVVEKILLFRDRPFSWLLGGGLECHVSAIESCAAPERGAFR
jgi:hypothetical protein